jgi:hypothetical protein
MVFINCGEASPTDEGKKDGLNKVWWIGDWEELRHAVPGTAGSCRGCSAGRLRCRGHRCQAGVGQETRGARWRLALRQVSVLWVGEQVGCSGRVLAGNGALSDWDEL